MLLAAMTGWPRDPEAWHDHAYELAVTDPVCAGSLCGQHAERYKRLHAEMEVVSVDELTEWVKGLSRFSLIFNLNLPREGELCNHFSSKLDIYVSINHLLMNNSIGKQMDLDGPKVMLHAYIDWQSLAEDILEKDYHRILCDGHYYMVEHCSYMDDWFGGDTLAIHYTRSPNPNARSRLELANQSEPLAVKVAKWGGQSTRAEEEE